MTLPVRRRIEERAGAIVGRETEQAVLDGLLTATGPAVVFISGIGGVGKSALLDAFSLSARAAGATVLRLDGAAVEPTERGFLTALGGAVGQDPGTAEEAAERLARLGDRVVVILDRYEVLRPLDLWLREALVPALGPNVRMILAGREPPMTAWSGLLGNLFLSLPLGNLSRPDSLRLLAELEVGEAEAARMYRIARGHPLSLRLAATAMHGAPALDHQGTTVNAIVSELTRLYLGDLDAATRRALDAAALVRRPTMSLLGAILPDAAPQDAWERLRALPFVELTDDGLTLHDTVREAVAAFLRSSDPERSRGYRVAAWRQLRSEVARAGAHEMWRYTADLLFMLENTMIREAFFPTTEHRYFVEPARPADWPTIEEIARRNEPPSSVALLATWWEREMRTFRVARDGAGQVQGFSVVGELNRISQRLVELDPVARRWRDHLRHQPVGRSERVLFERFELVREHEDSEALVAAALVLDLKRMYMELRPDLRRIYIGERASVVGTPWELLGFADVPGDPPRFDTTPYFPAFLDFGPESVDGWLTRIIAVELHVEDDAILDVAQRQLVLDGRRIDLTKLEFEVLHYLCQRPGRAVERAVLLREVWGYDDASGSNVIDVMVTSLRRKLGERSAAIQTVRGVGYRYVATA